MPGEIDSVMKIRWPNPDTEIAVESSDKRSELKMDVPNCRQRTLNSARIQILKWDFWLSQPPLTVGKQANSHPSFRTKCSDA